MVGYTVYETRLFLHELAPVFCNWLQFLYCVSYAFRSVSKFVNLQTIFRMHKSLSKVVNRNITARSVDNQNLEASPLHT